MSDTVAYPHRLMHPLSRPFPPHMYMCNSFTPADFEGGASASAEQRKVSIKRLTIDRHEFQYMDQEKVDHSEMGGLVMGTGRGEQYRGKFLDVQRSASLVPGSAMLTHSRVRHASFCPSVSGVRVSCHRNIKNTKSHHHLLSDTVFCFVSVNSLLLLSGCVAQPRWK